MRNEVSRLTLYLVPHTSNLKPQTSNLKPETSFGEGGNPMRTPDHPNPPECVASLLDIIPDAAYFIDTAGHVQYANAVAARQEAGALAVGADLARLRLTDPGGAALPYES